MLRLPNRPRLGRGIAKGSVKASAVPDVAAKLGKPEPKLLEPKLPRGGRSDSGDAIDSRSQKTSFVDV